LLRKHQVDFNTLTVVNRINSREPLEVYDFLKESGSGFIQFIPLVERLAERGSELTYADPPEPGTSPVAAPVTKWSVQPAQYGEFLVTIFDEWVRNDVGKVFVQMFDVALGNWVGAGSSLCIFAEKCGGALAVEHNGDVYSCDHYVYPEYRLGNLLNQSLGDLVNTEVQAKFGNDKLDTLPEYCRKCEVRFACRGARVKLPLRGVQAVFLARGSVHALHGKVAGRGAPPCVDHGLSEARGGRGASGSEPAMKIGSFSGRRTRWGRSSGALLF
jgi:uncharacterized protein